MDRERYIRVVSGDARETSASVARASLSLLSGFYFLGIKARQAAYDLGLMRQSRVKARVVSIGNITVGGTGKTPAAIYFSRRFLEEGKNVVVLSRGYGRATPINEPLAVSNHREILLSPDKSGDEPYLIAKKLPGVPVVVCGNRVRGANFAIEKFDAEIIVLDDGFQHIALARDEDIVVIDCMVPFGFGHMLPRGLLREPLRALRRATAFLLTHADKREPTHIIDRLKQINSGADVLKSMHRPVRLIRLKDGNDLPCDLLSGKKVLALSSIGNPNSFEESLRRLGAKIADSLVFEDHHRYDLSDIGRIKRAAEQSGADHIVSTEKDGVRLALVVEMPDILLLEVELELIDNLTKAET